MKRSLEEVAAFRLPNQTNRLALIMDPLTDQVPFTFGIEIFEKGHKTTPHTHPTSQELFFILAGKTLATSDRLPSPDTFLSLRECSLCGALTRTYHYLLLTPTSVSPAGYDT